MKRIYYSKLEIKVLERTSELKETEKALRNSQAELEEKVIERTKELAAANEKLKELNTSKDKFFSIIAHDMKSSFTGLFGYSEVLKNGAQTMSKQAIVDCSEKLYKNVNNSFNLLENLLNWALLQTGRMTCNPEQIEFNQDMSNILELFEENAKVKNIILQNDIKDDLILKADRNMLRTMIHNLVSNAIKFTNSGGKVIISSKVSNGSTEISVSDNGVGIPKEYVTRLFNLDSNITTKGTAKEKGTGLGLLLCKEMMDMHKGKITVESESGVGTTFKLILPN
jgi:signal transduction histidine kinase